MFNLTLRGFNLPHIPALRKTRTYPDVQVLYNCAEFGVKI